MNIEIRVATPTDAGLLHELIVELAAAQGKFEGLTVTPEILFRQMSQPHPPFEAAIVEVDGKPAGHLLFFQSYSTWDGRPGIYMEDLYVRAELRRCGIAKHFCSWLARVARERGCSRIEWSTQKSNENAQRFYRSLNAQALNDWVHFRLERDEIKVLSEARTTVLA